MKRKGKDSYEKYTESIKIPGSNPNNSAGVEDECVSLTLEVTLNNPTFAITKLKEDDILTVQLSTKDLVEVVNSDNEVCGTINHPKAPRLASCLKKNHVFIATVLNIQDSSCKVFIKNSNS